MQDTSISRGPACIDYLSVGGCIMRFMIYRVHTCQYKGYKKCTLNSGSEYYIYTYVMTL